MAERKQPTPPPPDAVKPEPPPAPPAIVDRRLQLHREYFGDVQTATPGPQLYTRQDVHDLIVQLSPWSHHHAWCARIAEAGECDCGLQLALEPWSAGPTISPTGE